MFEGASWLLTVTVRFYGVGKQSIETVNFELFASDLGVAIFDVTLLLRDVLLLFF